MKLEREAVLILHNLPRQPAEPEGAGIPRAESEAGVMDEVLAVSRSLEELRIPHRTVALRELNELPLALSISAERLVFNLVEGFQRRPADAVLVPAICQAYGKAFTGSDTPCQTLTLNKWRTKAVLRAARLPVPPGTLVPVGKPVGEADLPAPPWIVKPVYMDASEGIDAASVVRKPGAALKRAVLRVHETFHQAALVEQFVGSRELNVSVLRRGRRTEVLPIAEIDFGAFGPERPRIVDYAAKWLPHSFEYRNTPRIIPAPLDPRLADRIRHYALAAWRAVGCRDYARVDLRMDDHGQVTILEVNSNPDVSPEAGFSAALAAAGIPYREFVLAMVRNAAARLRRLQPAASRERQRHAALTPPPHVRPMRPSDRDAILQFLDGTHFFRSIELDIAREVLDDAVAKGARSQYQCYVADEGGQPTGWISFGATACAVGTFDIFWLAVAPDRQRRGIGRQLLDHAEALIRQQQGRLIVIDTSGRPEYQATRGFYLAAGYSEAARIADFYAPGDDRIIYTKVLARRPPGAPPA